MKKISISKSNKPLLVLFGVLLTTRILNAQDVALPFDVNEVIEQVTHNDRFAGTRNGEFLINESVSYVPAASGQEEASIAFDGINYLIVWVDSRNIAFDIYGARVSPNGTVLDISGIVISTAPGWQLCPSVAFDGTNYLVVWQDGRMYPASIDIYGVRVSPDGTVLGPGEIAISTVASGKFYPCVAFDGTNYLVAWMDSRNGITNYDIYGARVSPTGMVLDPSGIAISTAGADQMVPSIAFDGTNYLVVWDDRNDFSDIYGARVSPTGTVLDSSGIAISTAVYDQRDPSIVFDGTNYLVVWQDKRIGSFNYDIYGARVSPTGTVMDPNGILISNAAHFQENPSVTFDGTNYLVMWEDNRNTPGGPFDFCDIYGARVSPDGMVLDPDGIAVSSGADDKTDPSVAFDGTNCLVVWADKRSVSFSYKDIYGARVSATGTVLDQVGIALSITANDQWSPSVAFDGTNYLVAWHDRRSDSSYTDIYGARISPTGIILDPDGIAISTAPNYQYDPSVAFDGSNYLIVWEDNRNSPSGPFDFCDIYGARVSPDGMVLDPDGITVSTGVDDKTDPSVAFDGTNYLVVWMDSRSGITNYDIYGARMSPTGTVLDPNGIAISTMPQGQFLPSIAFDGTNYLVCWRYDYSIYGARVSPNGTVLDPNGIAIPSVADGQPSIAFDGSNYLVVWEDMRNNSFDVYGTRVSPNGTVLDPSGIAISTAADWQLAPSVAFDGTNNLVAWEDNRNGTYDIYSAKVSPTGMVIDTAAISLQPGNQTSAALSRGDGNQLLIGYSGFTDSINGYLVNTMRIWGRFYPFVGIEEHKPSHPYATILQISPNPFHQKTQIRYTIHDTRYMMEQGNQKPGLKICDAVGRLVKSFNLTSHIAHPTSVIIWDGTDQSCRQLGSGVYFLRLQAGDYSATEKVLLIR